MTETRLTERFQIYCDLTNQPYGQRTSIQVSLRSRRGASTAVPLEFVRAAFIEVSERGFPATGSTIRCFGVECQGALDAHFTLQLTAPAGTRVRYGDQTSTVTSGPVSMTNDPVAIAVATPIQTLFGRDTQWTSIPFVVDSPTGVHVETTVQISNVALRTALEERLQRLGSAPLLLPGETASPGRRGNLLTTTGDLVGAATRIADVDLIAVESTRSQTRGCGTFRNSRTGESRGVTVARVDASFRVYERTTGRLVAQRTFSGRMPQCPSAIRGSSADGERGDPDGEVISAWLQGQIARP